MIHLTTTTPTKKQWHLDVPHSIQYVNWPSFATLCTTSFALIQLGFQNSLFWASYWAVLPPLMRNRNRCKEVIGTRKKKQFLRGKNLPPARQDARATKQRRRPWGVHNQPSILGGNLPFRPGPALPSVILVIHSPKKGKQFVCYYCSGSIPRKLS